MNELEKALTQGRTQRAMDDTVRWSGKFVFMIIDAVLSVLAGLVSESALVGFSVFLILIFIAFIVFFDLAPIRQRDILRIGYDQLKNKTQQEISTLSEKLKNNQPSFILREARNVGHGFNQANGVINFQGEVVICNNGGSPSAITRIDAHIKISGKLIELDRVDRSQYENFVVEDNQSSVTFESMDFLDEKTIEKPIKPGACKIGMLVYEPTNAKDAEFLKNNVTEITAFIVIFSDVHGNEYPFSMSKVSKNNIPRKNFPGSPTRRK